MKEHVQSLRCYLELKLKLQILTLHPHCLSMTTLILLNDITETNLEKVILKGAYLCKL